MSESGSAVDYVLLVVDGPARGSEFPLPNGSKLILGRGVQSHTRIRDAEMSRKHCEIENVDGVVTITDSQSSAGTFINGEVIDSTHLDVGAVVTTGSTEFVLHVLGDEAHAESSLRTIQELREGKEAAAQKVWDNLYGQVVRLVRQRMGFQGRDFDEEDVAQSAIKSVFVRLRDGAFPNLRHRDELARLVATIALNKLANRIEKRLAKKRGEGKVRGESVFVGKNGDKRIEAAGDGPQPEDVAIFRDIKERLFAILEDSLTQEIAELKLAGYSEQEIAEKTGVVVRTVQRKIRRIREVWAAELEKVNQH